MLALKAVAGTLFLGAVFAALAVAYFIPTIAAYRRKHPQREAIGIVNLLFGWTVLGWVIALIWVGTKAEDHAPNAG